ncbi:unnamed protein product, partial [Vitrella brassicaformis CCMP3155]
WHTTFVSELSKGQQLMQKELGAATTRGPTDTNSASALPAPLAPADEKRLKEDMLAATAALCRHPSSRLFRWPYPHPEYTRMSREGRALSISDLEMMVPLYVKKGSAMGWLRWYDYIATIAHNAIDFTKAGSEVEQAAKALLSVAARLVRPHDTLVELSIRKAIGSQADATIYDTGCADEDVLDGRSELTCVELADVWDSCRKEQYLPWAEAFEAEMGGAAPLAATDSARVGRSPSPTGESYRSATSSSPTRVRPDRSASTGGPNDTGMEAADKCATLDINILEASDGKLEAALDAHRVEKNELDRTIKRLQDDVKKLTGELDASREMAEKERKAADAQRSTLEDILKDKDKQIKQAQKTADDRVRRVSQQVREEADKVAKTHMVTVTKQHKEELDRLRGEHRSAFLELRAQHRTAMEQQTEMRVAAERALADGTRERDQLRQRLREERLRSARVDQERDGELRRLREAEAPLRREILTLKQQLSSAQPPHSRVSAEGVSSLDLPSVRRLLDGLTSEQHRLAQLHQAAIERQIQLLQHRQQPNQTPSSASSSAAPSAPSMPFSLTMDGSNDPEASSAAPAANGSSSSSSAHAKGPCAAAAAASSCDGGGGVGPGESKCQLCLENPPDIILLPCGHRVVCQECFEKWMAPMPTEDKLCPEHTCRQRYSEVRYVFA